MNRLAQRLVFAQLMDSLTFAAFFMLVPASLAVERNPLIATIYAFGGVAAVVLFKMGYTLFVARRALAFAPSRKLVVAISISTASGCAGAGMNLASLVRSL